MEDVFGLVGLALENKYVIEAVVAAGGFGVVYRGRHTVLGSPIALKVLKIPETLPRRMHAGFVQQFVEEARIISQLQHPCIVRVSDFGVIALPEGQRAPWMVLEWIDGETLSQHLSARRGSGGRSPREVLALMRPVLEAVALAHERGIVHRDLKPGNLMLPRVDLSTTSASSPRSAGRPPNVSLRLLDFGLAKMIDESDGPASGHTRTTSAMPAFSPRYASPEQCSGTRTGPWTDVHALGLMLTELLVDASPYKATDKMELQIRVMSPTRPTPARFGIDVGAWEPVLTRAVALLPADRFANAGELLDALEANVPERVSTVAPEPARSTSEVAATSEPVHTTSPSTSPSPTAPTPRPLRVWASALGLVALGAVVAIVGVRMSAPTAAPTRPAAPVASPTATPPAPTPAAPVPTPTVAAVADASAAPLTAAVDEAPRGGRRPRIRRNNSARVRPWEQ